MQLMPTIIFGQDINIQSLKSLNNEDLKTYLNQAQEEGYSLDQIKIMAKAQGLSDFEISRIREGEILADFTAKAMRVCTHFGSKYVLENGHRTRLWDWQSISESLAWMVHINGRSANRSIWRSIRYAADRR